MEDSRNIIKAIDALTLKAGGEVVDSKNITEAIDHLKEVYSQEAIGIDDTLTQEGLAADAKAVGDAIEAASSSIISSEASVVLNDEYVSTAYYNVVNKIGNTVFYNIMFVTSKEVPQMETVATMPYISKYRHDTAFTLANGTPLTGGYIGASSQLLKPNGAVIPEGSTVTISGFYTAKK